MSVLDKRLLIMSPWRWRLLMTATKPVSQEHIEIVEGALGPKARIIGHRIRVKDIVMWHEHQRAPVDEIVERFPQLTRGDVHAALS